MIAPRAIMNREKPMAMRALSPVRPFFLLTARGRELAQHPPQRFGLAREVLGGLCELLLGRGTTQAMVFRAPVAQALLEQRLVGASPGASSGNTATRRTPRGKPCRRRAAARAFPPRAGAAPPSPRACSATTRRRRSWTRPGGCGGRTPSRRPGHWNVEGRDRGCPESRTTRVVTFRGG